MMAGVRKTMTVKVAGVRALLILIVMGDAMIDFPVGETVPGGVTTSVNQGGVYVRLAGNQAMDRYG